MVDRALEAEPEAADKVREGNMKAIGPIVGVRHARDQGPRRRRRGDPDHPPEAGPVMAWDVVIAGGGFGGASAARELERLLPKQSARLVLVNDVNFLLYTPFLPEAAAGTLEPRHVVTPLRDILKRTYLRLGGVTGHDPGGPHGSAPHPRGRGRRAALRPAPAGAGLGLAAVAGARPRPARDRVQEPRRRDLAAQPRGRDARGGERERGSGPSRRAAHLRLRRRRLRRARGAGRASGLRRRRDGLLSARPAARDALDPGRGDRQGAS